MGVLLMTMRCVGQDSHRRVVLSGRSRVALVAREGMAVIVLNTPGIAVGIEMDLDGVEIVAVMEPEAESRRTNVKSAAGKKGLIVMSACSKHNQLWARRHRDILVDVDAMILVKS